MGVAPRLQSTGDPPGGVNVCGLHPGTGEEASGSVPQDGGEAGRILVARVGELVVLLSRVGEPGVAILLALALATELGVAPPRVQKVGEDVETKRCLGSPRPGLGKRIPMPAELGMTTSRVSIDGELQGEARVTSVRKGLVCRNGLACRSLLGLSERCLATAAASAAAAAGGGCKPDESVPGKEPSHPAWSMLRRRSRRPVRGGRCSADWSAESSE